MSLLIPYIQAAWYNADGSVTKDTFSVPLSEKRLATMTAWCMEMNAKYGAGTYWVHYSKGVPDTFFDFDNTKGV